MWTQPQIADDPGPMSPEFAAELIACETFTNVQLSPFQEDGTAYKLKLPVFPYGAPPLFSPGVPNPYREVLMMSPTTAVQMAVGMIDQFDLWNPTVAQFLDDTPSGERSK